MSCVSVSSFHKGRHNYNIYQALLENKHKITIKSDDGLQSAHGKKIEMLIHQLMYEFWLQHLPETWHLPIKMSLREGVGKLDILMFMSINSSFQMTCLLHPHKMHGCMVPLCDKESTFIMKLRWPSDKVCKNNVGSSIFNWISFWVFMLFLYE